MIQVPSSAGSSESEFSVGDQIRTDTCNLPYKFLIAMLGHHASYGIPVLDCAVDETRKLGQCSRSEGEPSLRLPVLSHPPCW